MRPPVTLNPRAVQQAEAAGRMRSASDSKAAADEIAAVSILLSDHEAAPDPHPGYLTQAEADALYEALGGGGGGGMTIGQSIAIGRANFLI